jgi:hypothetical protein
VPAQPEAPSSGAAAIAAAAAELAAALGELSAGRSEFTGTLAAIKQARAAGDPTEVARLKAEFAAHSAATPPPTDPVDRLERLADLHDRGVLTDDEFARQKAKILNEPG